MKSPFPGMDPYLEQFWPDVHARMIFYACDQLEEQLPGNLIARVEERVVLETEEAAHGVYLERQDPRIRRVCGAAGCPSASKSTPCRSAARCRPCAYPCGRKTRKYTSISRRSRNKRTARGGIT